MSRRDDDYKARSGQIEQRRRNPTSERPARNSDSDLGSQRHEVESSNVPRYDGDRGTITEEELAGERQTGSNYYPSRHDRPASNRQTQNDYRTSHTGRQRERNSSFSSGNSNSREYVLESGSQRRPHQNTPQSSQQFPASRSHSNQSSVSQPVFSTILDSLGRAFVSIPVGEYEKCRIFILSNPNVLEQDESLYIREAIAALRFGKNSHAWSCIQQALLIRELKNMSDKRRQHFFELLEVKDEEVYGDLVDNFDRTLITVRKRAGVSVAEPRSQPNPAATAGSHKPSSVADRHLERPQVIDDKDQQSSNRRRESQVSSNAMKHINSDRHQTSAPKLDTTQVCDNNDDGTRASHPNTELPAAFSRLEMGSSHLPTGVNNSQFYGSNRTAQGHSQDHQGRHDQGFDRARASGPISLQLPADVMNLPMWKSRGTDFAGFMKADRSLDGRFYKRSSAEAGRFFKVGRVFSILWHEPAGNRSRDCSTGPFNENIHSEIRFMAVVREFHGYCWAIPISTYGFQGVAKPGFNQANIDGHAVIYMQGQQPYTADNEPEMSKRPIQVVPANSDQTLHRMSRINFMKVHTVEHNVKVMHVGHIATPSRPYFNSYWNGEAPPPPPPPQQKRR